MSEDKRTGRIEQLNPLYRTAEGGRLECLVCAHGCRLKDGQLGICGVRRRIDDKLVSLVYGRVVAEHIDPIEKKPLFHVLPGSLSFSIATPGCNFRCLHCQNSSISQVAKHDEVQSAGTYLPPESVAERALSGGCRSVSYTYVEPTVFFEYAYDCCLAAMDRGLKNIFVSNGYMTETIIKTLAPVLTAINIDLKSFSDDFYKKVCGARLAPVLEAIRLMKDLGVWVEVTTLIIPGRNDSEVELAKIASFLAGVDNNIPWHVTGFYPAYKMSDVPPTGEKILSRAREIGIEQGLHFVYTGNRPGSGGENSHCPSCGMEIIRRYGFQVGADRLVDGCCPGCSMPVAGVWS
ncbi:MAG: AmmeMemoRadiSam system radical SAM enzyme [Desulforhopalus sp.]